MDAAHILENVYRANRKVRTLDDLLNIQLEPTNRPIKLVYDSYVPGDGIIPEHKWSQALQLYEALRRNGPATKSRLDKFRWALRLKLIAWRII